MESPTPPLIRKARHRYDAKLVGAVMIGMALIALGILAYLAYSML